MTVSNFERPSDERILEFCQWQSKQPAFTSKGEWRESADAAGFTDIRDASMGRVVAKLRELAASDVKHANLLEAEAATRPSIDPALAIAKHIEALLPPVDEIADALAIANGEVGELGPTVTLPAVYVRILATAYRAELLEREHQAMRAKIARAEEKPGIALDDDQFNALSVRLANEALALSFLPLEGASALWKAAATIAMAHVPTGAVLGALDHMHAMARADVAAAIGLGATKQ